MYLNIFLSIQFLSGGRCSARKKRQASVCQTLALYVIVSEPQKGNDLLKRLRRRVNQNLKSAPMPMTRLLRVKQS